MSGAERPVEEPVVDDAAIAEELAEVIAPARGDADDERGEVERERDEYLDTLRRVQADFENYRKRVTRASEEAADRASGALAATLLPVLDALDLADAHFAQGEEGEGGALRQARGLLLATLAKEGLERIDEAAVAFDPTVHDAVAHQPADDPDAHEQIVAEVLRAGYRWRGAVLRPAMVRVKG